MTRCWISASGRAWKRGNWHRKLTPGAPYIDLDDMLSSETAGNRWLYELQCRGIEVRTELLWESLGLSKGHGGRRGDFSAGRTAGCQKNCDDRRPACGVSRR